ncbi:MAG: SDR family oxidoreductase, partial [Ruminiclostridium sp.]
KKKIIHHISTPLVAFGEIKGVEDFLYTEDDHYVGQEDDNVYFRTKLEAEKLIEEARQNGVTCNIYRMGNLVYNSETFKFQENIDSNAFYTVIKSFIKINMIPAFDKDVLDLSFVDHVSKAVLLIFNKKNLANKTYHVYNHNRISTITLGQYIQQAGYESLNISDISELFRRYEEPEMRDYIMNVIIHAGLMGNIRGTSFHMLCDRTQMILGQLGFNWSEINNTHIQKLIEYCKEVNFI